MYDCTPYLNVISPSDIYQQANLLWGYAFGLSTVIPFVALWRWLRV